jgi:hypothetical protein
MTERPRPLGWTGPTGAKITAHLHFNAATDNRRGRAQTVVSGVAEVYDWTDNTLHQQDGWTGTEISIVDGLDLFDHSARFLIMNPSTGETTLYYASGYHPKERYIGLKRLTASSVFDPESDGPRRLYTLFVRTTDRLHESNENDECRNGSPTCTEADPCVLCNDEEN